MPRNRMFICQTLYGLAALLALGVQSAFASVNYDDLRALAPESRLRETIGFLAGLDSRVTGYPGAEQATRYVQRQFTEIGLDDIILHKYDVSVPVEKGGFLQVEGDSPPIDLHGLWPNLVRTPTLPDGGLDGLLLYGGTGEYEELDGLDLKGAVVLLDFNSGDNWLNCAYLGAAAVVFSEPDSTVYLEGERKFLTMPLDLPRFWVTKAAGDQLRAAARTGVSQVHLEYRMDWERQPAWNVLGFIPGYDPLLQKDVIVIE
ncbi:MAG: hypothetical protein VX255_15145 [Candidatus Latescibacterota bacterium]|nr:hypothetical protein [Candidatus Latescibacterota bacterium]